MYFSVSLCAEEISSFVRLKTRTPIIVRSRCIPTIAEEEEEEEKDEEAHTHTHTHLHLLSMDSFQTRMSSNGASSRNRIRLNRSVSLF